MNGVTDSYIDYTQPRPDDDEPFGPAGLDCPFCGCEIEWDGWVLCCDWCELIWHSGDEYRADVAACKSLDIHQHREP